MNHTTNPKTDLFVPPAAEGLPLAALDSATVGADRLDAAALTPTGRNFLAHALVQLARDGWLRTEPGEGFEPVRDRKAPEPAVSPSVVVSADRATLRDRIADIVMPFLLNFSDEESARINAAEVATALLAVLPAPEAVCICGHTAQQHFEDVCITEITGCSCGDFLPADAAAEEIARLQQIVREQSPNKIAELPDRLEAALTERFTALGNPFSEMRRHEQGPDGWPASRPVGPHHVAEVLRELMAEHQPAVGEQPDTQEADRIVAYSPGGRTLRCLDCRPNPLGSDWRALTAAELEDGGICTVCGVDVLIPLEAGQ